MEQMSYTIPVLLPLICGFIHPGSAYMEVSSPDLEELRLAAYNSTTSRLLTELLKKSDERVRPNVTGDPVTIYCDIFVSSFGSINARDMDFQVDVYFRQRWHDPRLEFDNQTEPVMISAKLLEEIWLPDVFFPNEKSASIHDVMTANKVALIFPNGTVRLSTRLDLKLSCPMKLTYFPMDYQICYVKISSFAYTMKDLVLQWDSVTPIEMHQHELYLPQFTLESCSANECENQLRNDPDAYPETELLLEWEDQDAVDMDKKQLFLPQFNLESCSTTRCKESYKTGKFSCIMANFHLKREFGYYMLQSYIPSILIVIISWVSFWIHKNAVPARITLGVTTVLTMATQLQSAQGSQVVAYARAIDVWFAFCMILVFSTLIEYAFVNSLVRMEQEHEDKASKDDGSVNASSEDIDDHDDPRAINIDTVKDEEVELHEMSPNSSPDKSCTTHVMSPRARACSKWQVIKEKLNNSDGVDQMSRILYPTIFALFNLVYWAVYSQKRILTDVDPMRLACRS